MIIFSVFSASWILYGTHVTTIVKYLHTQTRQFFLKISIHQNHNRTSKKYGNKFLKRSALPKILSKVNLPQFCIYTVKKKSRLENKSLNPTFKLKKLLQIGVIYTFTMDASINLHKKFAVFECLIKCVDVLL